MPYPYSGDTTVFGSSISLIDATARRDQVLASRVSSSVSILAAEIWAGTSGVSLQSGARISGVTLDLRTNSVIPSSVTYGANPSGMTIGQWGFVFNASGLSVFFSSGASIYFFGGSTLSAAQS